MVSRPRSSSGCSRSSWFAAASPLASSWRRRMARMRASSSRCEKGFAIYIVGAHGEAERLVELVVLGGQEDHRHRAMLADPAQQLHSVHLRHLDVEHREIRRILADRLQGDGRIGVDARHEPLGLKGDRDRREDVAVVIDQRDYLAHPPLLCPSRLTTRA